MRLSILAAAAALALTAGGFAPAALAQTPAPPAGGAPAGDYKLDKYHASLTFRLSHLGFSNYTASFKEFDVRLKLDPAAPEKAVVEADIDPASLHIDRTPEGFLDTLKGPQWLDAKTYPKITFRSTSVTPTGPTTATVVGDLTLHGVTKPVTLTATFNGGYPGMAPFDPNGRVGFSARGSFNRSDFGMGYGVPPPGTKVGVSDAVEVIIEAEFNGPPLKK